MAATEERQPLLEAKKSRLSKQRTASTDSMFSSEKSVTPEFITFDWWVLNFLCLFTIFMLSTWQVAGKTAMSLRLEDTSEVII
jgi:hypothetical protein